MKWFKHDSDANRDAKLEKVLMRYGAEGYALYWLCLELITAPIDKTNITFELEHDAEILAHRLKMDSARVEVIMRDMVKLDLFEIDQTSKRITCLKLATRLENSIVKNPQLKEIQDFIHNKQQESGIIPDDYGKVRLDIDIDTDKDIEVDINNNLNMKKRSSRFIPPSLDEVKAYCLERRNHVDPQDFVDHYEANGWMRGKSKVKDWKACVRTWEKSAIKKSQQETKPICDNEWIALGKQNDINPRPGESMWDFKRRVSGAVYGQ